ncbi:MAG: amidase, partial [Nitrospira sp.]|nr:amidase [Nitrospira sp.]
MDDEKTLDKQRTVIKTVGTELIYASATTLAQAIRTKKVSSEEVVQAHLQRIEAVNPKLNAIVRLTAEVALAQAREADAALAQGKLKGSLHGVPMTIKDSLDTAGVISTGGTQGRASFMSKQDATVVARLRAAGAILLGKTNLPELSLGYESDNLVYGRANNPYDLSRTPGGSSGGEAAIIAAGGSPFGLGADAGGSIRVPAHFCGIAGIKPTTDRVPRTGHFPPFGGIRTALWQIGPMARFVEDLILILPIIAGVDWHDPMVVPMSLGDPGAVGLKSLRIAFHTNDGIVPPTAETVMVIRTAARVLADAGMVVEEARPEGIEQSNELLLGVMGADGGAGVRKILQMAGTTEIYPLLQRRLEMMPPSISAAELGDLMAKWDTFRSTMISFMEKYDVIICPVCAYPALPHGVTLDADKFPGFSYTRTYNLTG